MEYTREDLIKICEKAFVSEDKWNNRDSEQAQSKLGQCYALLKDGCDFEVIYDNEMCGTDEYTIWLYVYSKGFYYFDTASPDDTMEDLRQLKEQYHFYLPTQKRLDEVNGGDWY